jgi:predicted MFS family arabinose efflux permease
LRIAAIFGLNQIVSHGFGVFLFAALVPLMRESVAITNWHLATIGALSQLSYLGGALLLGMIGHRFSSARLVLTTGGVTTALLFTMSQLQDPLIITLVLVVLAASAAISWGTIVEIISRCAKPEQCSTYLSCAASGTAWGYGLNGLLILVVVPVLGWQSSWQIAGAFGLLVLGMTWQLLSSISRDAPSDDVQPEATIPASKLLTTIFNERTALFACIICFFVGFSTMPFANWLNTYLDELGLPVAIGGYTWAIVGLSGMAAGFVTGFIADRMGHAIALLIIFSGFGICLLIFIYDPTRFAFIAGFGYGLMYFPVWGILAGWIRQRYSSTATMQISSICMVASGLGGALGNLLAGYIRDTTGSLEFVYMIVTAAVLLLVLLAIFILCSGRNSNQAVSVGQ